MKKIMFGAVMAAVVASNVSFGADVYDFDAEKGVYNITITQKVVEPTYGARTEGYPIECTASTKKLAQNAAKDEFCTYKDDEDLYPGARITKTSTKKEAGEWVCRISWTYIDKSVVTGAKTVTETAAGILVKGDYKGDFVEDGALLIWSKNKENKIGNKFVAVSYDKAWIEAAAYGKTAAGRISIWDDLHLYGVGFGSAASGFVKTLSGQMILDCKELVDCGYGSWQIQKDATCTKLAEQGYDINAILAKKGAVEAADDPE